MRRCARQALGPMKKLLAVFPAHIDWSSAVKDGLVFGITAALAIHLLPALSRAILVALGRTDTSTPQTAPSAAAE